jgi:hypothetical protein
MDSAEATVKGVNAGMGGVHKDLTPIYPSVNTGDSRFPHHDVYREFTHGTYGEDMHDRTAVALADPPLPLAGIQTVDSTQAAPPAPEEWRLAQRIAASRGFRKSELLKGFLLEVCELALAGRADEITEKRLGICIFGRSSGYDPGEDNVVRSYARMLRKRLEAYFADEGAHEPLRLTIPRGGYTPLFEVAPMARNRIAPIATSLRTAEADAPPTAGHARKARRHWVWVTCGMVAGAVLALLAGIGIATVEAHRQASATHALWTQLFEKDRNTLIVSADSGLGIVENLTHTQASLEDYASGAYFTRLSGRTGLSAGNLNDLSRQHYTSEVDLRIATELERLPEFTADRTQLLSARNLTVDEMRHANVILIGSVHSNPWVALFEPRLNFQLAYTSEVDQSHVINRHPRAGEQSVYNNGTADGRGPTYGLVAYQPNAGGAGRVLIVEGLNMAATQAAADILFSTEAMAPVLRAARAPDGRLSPFELLIETVSVGASAPTARVVSTRIYPEQ